tara:strand:- start:5161 stop:6018 length:858 start_codon:yes stop_codon:yes gene_type:complete
MEECKIVIEKKHSLNKIKKMSFNMRKNILQMAFSAGSSSTHFGGGLSIVDITATLYGAILSFHPKDPEWEERDRFILSKGHGVLGYYTALHEIGYITLEELHTFEKDGTFLFGHPIMKRSKGIEFSNGSLGMGLSLGVGVSLSAKIKNLDSKVYVLMGDGECNEGSVWEAAMSASHYQLKNIIAVIDRNNFQQTGSSTDIMNMDDLVLKWRSFNWDVVEIDGHDIHQLYETFSSLKNQYRPIAVIANTIKGKGFSISENNNNWHHSPITKSQYELCMDELNKKIL